MKYLLFIILFFPVISYSQSIKQPVHEKTSFVDSTGRYYQHADLPIYLMVASSPTGNPFPLKSTGSTEVMLEGNGVHSFKHENVVTNSVDEFQIYADGLPPQSTISFSNAAKSKKGVDEFCGKGLSIELTASDNMSGVSASYFSLDNAPFKKYSPSQFNKEGKFSYTYYSVDKTGNAEALRTRTFTVDLTAPETFHNFIGISSQNIISSNSSIYLTVSDTLSGIAKTYYKFDKEEFKPYYSGNIPFKYLSDSEHTLYYYSIDKVGNIEKEKEMSFYLDKTAPIMSADVLGDKFLVGERVYFSGRTKLKLTAIDNKSGIKEVAYSINNDPYLTYQEPFYLPNRSGIHNVKFKALDNKDNAVNDDFEHSVGVIYVDLTGPTLANSFTGTTFNKADTIFISPKTKIVITGTDPESGLQKLTYRLDGESTEVDYVEPILIEKKGFHTLDFFGYDNVSNRNAKSFYFVTDSQGPQITTQFAAPANAEGKYPTYTTIYLAAVDNEVGANEIRYSINGGKEQVYAAPLKGFKKNKKYTVAISATDMLGNESNYQLDFEVGKY